MAILSQAIQRDFCDRCGEVWFKGAMVMPVRFRNGIQFQVSTSPTLNIYCYDCAADMQSAILE